MFCFWFGEKLIIFSSESDPQRAMILSIMPDIFTLSHQSGGYIPLRALFILSQATLQSSADWHASSDAVSSSVMFIIAPSLP